MITRRLEHLQQVLNSKIAIDRGESSHENSGILGRTSASSNPATEDRILEAVHSRDIDNLRSLLIAGADCNKRDAEGQTPLHKAMLSNDPKTIHELLQYGAKLDIRDYRRCTPLDIAAMQGYSNIITMTIDWAINTDSIQGITSLHKECFRGHRDEVNSLLSQGSNPNAQDLYNATPLHYATFSDDSEIVRVLIDGGADVDCNSKHWGTALHKAAYAGMTEAVDLLLRAGADMLAIKEYGKWTPLGLALYHGHRALAARMYTSFVESGKSWNSGAIVNTWEQQNVEQFLHEIVLAPPG